FAYATLAYELLTGSLPGRVYVPASHHNRRLSVRVDDVLRKGLARNAEERAATVEEFREELYHALRPSRRRRLWGIFLAVSLCVGFLAFLLASRFNRNDPASTPAENVVPADRAGGAQPENVPLQRGARLLALTDRDDFFEWLGLEQSTQLRTRDNLRASHVPV